MCPFVFTQRDFRDFIVQESPKPFLSGSGDAAEQQVSESDDEACMLPVAANASLRPGIVHRLDKGTTGTHYTSITTTRAQQVTVMVV